MTRITVLPHAEYCPKGAVIEAKAGQSLCDALLDGGVEIDHACDRSCACTTCHVIVHEGFDALEEATENEEDLLDRAWGLTSHSRISCQVIVGATPLTVEIPRYTINLVREEKHG